jgi:GT2 family glycosyltransferase
MSTSNPANKVWVVIVTYNGAQWIEKCIRSIIDSSHVVRIVVIDNCSTDNTCAIVEQFSEVKLIKNKVNAGFGSANNAGISVALRKGADFVFLLNQDTSIWKDTITNLVKCFLQNSGAKYGVLSPLHLSSNNTDFDTGFLSYVLKDYSKNELDNFAKHSELSVLPVQFINAAAWMISGKVFEKIGGFAPLFFHYGEDRDFVNRLKYNSIKVGIVNHSSIIHYRDTRQMVTYNWTFKKRNKYYFVGWLSRISDVNTSLFAGWLDGFAWVLKESIFHLLNFKISTVFIFIKLNFTTLLKLPDIIKHRQIVKEELPYKFLQ